MLRGPLHDRGADGRCTECGERFPCPTGLAIFEAVKRELEHLTPPPPPTPAQRLRPHWCCIHHVGRTSTTARTAARAVSTGGYPTACRTKTTTAARCERTASTRPP